MAHKPKVKAAAVADLIAGCTQREVAEKYAVGTGTVARWSDELKSEQSGAIAPRDEQFAVNLKQLLSNAIKMLDTWANECQDPSFVRSNPTGVCELGQVVLDRCDRLVALVRPVDSSDSDQAA